MTPQERENLIESIIDDLMILCHGESCDNRQESQKDGES